MTTGVLLLNLGTPDAPRTPEVRRYLRQFLMDPYVVDIPYPARWLLVNGAILPRRPARSAEAYQKIWSERGSPLLFHTVDLAAKVGKLLGPGYSVRVCMRYGSPSIEAAVRELRKEGVTKVLALPLYPQYSYAASESSIVELKRVFKATGFPAPLEILPEFFADPGFISAFASIGRDSLAGFAPDHYLFSFHGIPERHLLRAGHASCDDGCREEVGAGNAKCYRAQCYVTARLIARELGLMPEQYSVSFQSRLGRTPWLRPFTDHLLDELPKNGVKRLAVYSPSFVVDCLETLEEISIRGHEQFVGAGGEDLRLVPSLNASDAWAETVAKMVRK